MRAALPFVDHFAAAHDLESLERLASRNWRPEAWDSASSSRSWSRRPAAAVWAYLTDPYRVATALPGAAVTEKVDDRTYNGTITVKVGPVSARYRGTARFEKLDAAAARGRGGGLRARTPAGAAART